MLLPVSSEFVTLCRSQVALLTQSLGASLSVVYLTEDFEDGVEAKLVPIVAYPETTAVWEAENALTLLPAEAETANRHPRLRSKEGVTVIESRAQSPGEIHIPLLESDPADLPIASDALPPEAWQPHPSPSPVNNNETSHSSESALWASRQIFLPLLHEEMVLGLLVTTRQDRPWNTAEQTQIEQIAQTIAIACVLDQRGQWLTQENQQQHLLQAQKQDLLHDLLHQFRNPLTALRTFGKLLLKRLNPSDPNREVGTSIVRESDRLQDLLQQFSQVVDLEAHPLPMPQNLMPTPTLEEPDTQISSPLAPGGKPSLEGHAPPQNFLLLPASQSLALTPHSLTEILLPLVDSATAIAQEQQLHLETQIAPELPPILTNPQALREVLSNLIDNALKYTPAEGQVLIAVGVLPDRSGENQLALAISDTGPGIPAQDLDHIFERHYRGVQAETAIPGTGLGLAIAKDLTEQIQGKLQVFSPALSSWGAIAAQNSPSPHPGTTFVIWLPLAQ